MKKYKINKNKPLPNDEKIKSHMDFNKLVGDYNKIHNYKDATKPLYKNPKFLSFIALLSTVILMFVLVDKENEEKLEVKKLRKNHDTTLVKAVTGDQSIKNHLPLKKNKIHKTVIKEKTVSSSDSLRKNTDTNTYHSEKALPPLNSDKKEKVIIRNGNDVFYKKDRKELEEEMLKRHGQ